MATFPTSALTSTTSTTAASSSSASDSNKTIANNFQTFMTLLTTQLQNQNPLDPLDTNQFTQQLVQFASVEQQIRTNDTLSALVSLTKASQTTSALGLIGAKITAEGTTAKLSNGSAQWAFNAPKPGTATVTITDSKGSTVLTQNVAVTAGENAFTWNGRTSTGSTAADGLYTMTVNARNAAGATMPVVSEVVGIVDGVDMTAATPTLTMGDISVPMEKVKSVRRL